jgi:hypothetical protein
MLKVAHGSPSVLIPIGMYLCLSVLYLFAIPSGESPDEPSHLRCIEQVSLENRLPEVDPKPTGLWWERTTTVSGYLCYHLPLYYLTAGFVQYAVNWTSGTPLHFEMPPNHPGWGKGAMSMFLHTDKSSFFIIPEPFTVVAVRIMSILLGLVTVWASYRTTAAIWPNDSTLPVLAASLCAGWPQFLFMQRAINNDILATALASAVLIVLLKAGQPRRFIWATGLACLALLAKLTMSFTLVAVALIGGLEWLICRTQRQAYLAPAVISLGITGTLVAILIFQPTINQNLLANQNGFGTISPQSSTLTYWLDVLKLSISSGFARFGWMNVPAPDWQAYLWWIFVAVTVLIGLVSILRTPRDQHAKLILITLFIWTAGVLVTYLRLNANRFQPQFRYAFPLLSIICAFAAAGWLQIAHRFTRKSVFVVGALIVLLVIINIYLIAAVIMPAYR